MKKNETAATVLTDLKWEFASAATDNRKPPEERAVYDAFATQVAGIVSILTSSHEKAKLTAIADLEELKTQFDNVVTRNQTGPFSFDSVQKSSEYGRYSKTVSKALKLI